MNIGIFGAAGRMGQMLVREVVQTEGARIAGGVEAAGHPANGFDVTQTAGLAASGKKIGTDPLALIKESEVLIDFTSPAATLNHAKLCAQNGKPLVIGTTGIEAAARVEIEGCSRQIPIVWASNYSVGVNVLFALTKQLAGVLGEDFDIEIVEMHHRHKVDAPSGTALTLGEMAAAGRGKSLKEISARGRDGITGARKKGDIGFAALRGGEVVGDHTVMFASDHERLELTHKASSREVFASGAVRAALWVAKQKPGLYSMADVLGLA